MPKAKRTAQALAGVASPDDIFAYGEGIPKDATWRNLLPAAELGLAMAPGSGEAMSARDAWRASGSGEQALREGRFADAAGDYSNLALSLAGALPGAGIVARGTKRGAAWMDRNMPSWVNRGLDAITPSDPKNTTFSGAGPTGGKSGRGSFELDYFGQPVKVLQNPSPQQMKGFLNRTQYKAARRIIDPDTGDVYIWDAGDPALHKLVAEQLGIDPVKMTADMIEMD